MRTLVCTAEPFGYGPSSSLAQIVARLETPGDEVCARYAGSGHTLAYARSSGVYGGRIDACSGSAQWTARLRGADAALIVGDFDAARAAARAGVPFAIYDPLAWYWAAFPAICRQADLYLCQDFFGVREKLAEAGLPNAVVVPPLTPAMEPSAERRGILISLGGLGNPYFTEARCVDYARAVLLALRRATEGEAGPVTSLTPRDVARSLGGLEVATLPPDEVHRHIGAASVCFLTPGLGQLYEAAALGARAVWLPPANDVQGRQLREVVARGMAPGAVDWHEFMDVQRVDYGGEPQEVMRRLSAYMEGLLGDTRAQARLAACVRTRMRGVRDAGENPLAALVVEMGTGGAEVAARALDAWLRSLDEPRRGTWRLGDAPASRDGVPTPPRLRLAPLAIPRENRAGDEAIVRMRALHEAVDGTGVHTLAPILEVARATRLRTPNPRPRDFARALADWRASGLALWARYGAGHATALAEVLRARIQRELGLTGLILCVPYAGGGCSPEHDWEYEGTVHADLLVPLLDRGRFRAVHLPCGQEIGVRFRVFEDEETLIGHLDGLGYARGAVVDPAALTREAFRILRHARIVEGPAVGEGSCALGLDAIDGTLSLDDAATARHGAPSSQHGGPRPPGEGPVRLPTAWASGIGVRELVDREGRLRKLPAAEAMRTVLEAIRVDFRQPAEFTDDLLFLAAHLDAWCEATLSAPGPSLRAAVRREAVTFEAPSRTVVEALSALDRGEEPPPLPPPLADARIPRAVAERRVREHARALRALPRSATRARHAMAAELVRLASMPPAPEADFEPGPDPPPSVLDPPPVASVDDTVPSVRFDPAGRRYVPTRMPAVLLHALHVRLAQFLEWDLDAIGFSAPSALVERLVAMSVDPATGEPLVDRDEIGRIVGAIAEARGSDDPLVAPLARGRVEIWLSAAGVDRPRRIEWRLAPATAARILAVLDDPRTRARLHEVAEAEAVAAAVPVEARRAALAAVLEQHRGTPRRHVRVHWAFVNLAIAGQTTIEMRAPGGVLPLATTSLDPSSLKARYAEAPRTALRFVLTDRFELNVLDDAGYWDTIARWGFPPNHELLACARPILASGYLTVERGRVVAVEDDGVMVPGKLGADLPPVQEVLEALGFDVDLDRIGEASLVIDWEAFAAATDRDERPPLPDLPAERMGEYLASRSHAERPVVLVAWLRSLRGERDAIVRSTVEALRGFRLINLGVRAILGGEVPRGAEWVDEATAPYLVRKAVGR